MSDQPSELKRLLRREMRAVIARLSEDERAAADARICSHLTALPEWRAAQTVLLYHPLPDEANIGGAIASALSEHKLLFLPRIAGTAVSFHRVTDRSVVDTLTAGRYGIREPDAAFESWPHAPAGRESAAVLVCPGRAFDRSGRRLGRGGGFYDRFLEEVTSLGLPVVAVGVAYEVQVIDHVPAEAHDARMDLLITEEGALRSAGETRGTA